MTGSCFIDWQDANNQILELAMSRVLAYFVDETTEHDQIDKSIALIERELSHPSSLKFITERFALSSMEQDALLIAVAVDLKPNYAAVIASHPLSVAGRATPALIRSVLQCDFSMLAADNTLRRARLITLQQGNGIADKILSVDEPVFQALNGHTYISSDIDAVSGWAEISISDSDDFSSQTGLPAILANGRKSGLNPVYLFNEIGFEKAANVLARQGLQLLELPAHSIPVEEHRLIDWAARLDRDLILTSSVLGINCFNNEADTISAVRFSDLMTAPVLIAASKKVPASRRTKVQVKENK